MKTDKNIKPLRKNCRVDIIYCNQKPYSCLIDYSNPNNERTIYYESGIITIGNLYRLFARIIADYFNTDIVCPRKIDNAPFMPFKKPFHKIDGIQYIY